MITTKYNARHYKAKALLANHTTLLLSKHKEWKLNKT